jgi:hypothetical protein
VKESRWRHDRIGHGGLMLSVSLDLHARRLSAERAGVLAYGSDAGDAAAHHDLLLSPLVGILVRPMTGLVVPGEYATVRATSPISWSERSLTCIGNIRPWPLPAVRDNAQAQSNPMRFAIDGVAVATGFWDCLASREAAEPEAMKGLRGQ